MFSRRDLLLGAAASFIPAFPALAPAFPALAAESTSEGEKLRALFDVLFRQQLERDPEMATSLGLDKGVDAGFKRRLGDRSPASVARDASETAARLVELRKIDRAALSRFDAASYDSVLYVEEVRDAGNRAFAYGGGSSGHPYILSQLSGAYQWIGDFLDREHGVTTTEDAEAYLARLDECARVMDEELDLTRRDASLGVAPPDFILDRTRKQMQLFLDTPAEKSVLVQSLVKRTKAIPGDWEARATIIYQSKILPALARQDAFLRQLRPDATAEAGVARLKDGGEYYRQSLHKYTTANLPPDEIHAEGLDLVARIQAEIAALLDAQGVAGGTVGARLAALGADPRFLYDNTDAAKERLIADLNLRVAAVREKLPAWFGALPQAPVEIRRVPRETELGAPGGYYNSGALDGSRPGACYINLRDTKELARWKLPTLTYHESIPGHHLQIALAQEAPALPLIRKAMHFSGYGEGWALYAEQLAVEMGLYADDPLGHVGQLQAALFRAARLVIDTGLHTRGWSREKAIAYFVETLGDKPSAATTEVERYCIWPGQACSYMVGKLTWLRLREQARAALGAAFDLKKFHDCGLLAGATPLAVLEKTIADGYINAAR